MTTFVYFAGYLNELKFEISVFYEASNFVKTWSLIICKAGSVEETILSNLE